MARPKIDLPPAVSLRALISVEGRLAVRVTPGSKTESLEIRGGQVLAKTRTGPQGGAANAAVTALLARALGCAPSRISLLRGATSREKVFGIDD